MNSALSSMVFPLLSTLKSFPGGSDRKESAYQFRKAGFDPWVWKTPWRREWQLHSGILAWRIPWTEEHFEDTVLFAWQGLNFQP